MSQFPTLCAVCSELPLLSVHAHSVHRTLLQLLLCVRTSSVGTNFYGPPLCRVKTQISKPLMAPDTSSSMPYVNLRQVGEHERLAHFTAFGTTTFFRIQKKKALKSLTLLTDAGHR